MKPEARSRRLSRVQEPFPHNFSAEEMESLAVLCDTLLAPVPGRARESLQLIQQIPPWSAGLMTQHLKPADLTSVRTVLWLLSTRLGTLLLCGPRFACTWIFPWVRPWRALPCQRREGALLSWASSRLLALRSLFKVLKAFCCSPYTTLLDADLCNPVLDAMGYHAPCMPQPGQAAIKGVAPGLPIAGQPSDQESKGVNRESNGASSVGGPTGADTTERARGASDRDEAAGQGSQGSRTSGEAASETTGERVALSPGTSLRDSVVDLADLAGPRFVEEMRCRGFSCHAGAVEELGGALQGIGEVPELSGAAELTVVDCDAVVIGSGCGGSVVAAQLAGARPGSRVVVLEKGRYYAGEEFSQLEAPSVGELFERGGFLASDGGSVSFMAGTCVGGGSVINWSASFRTPAHVRREWAQQYGLKQFESIEFDEALEAVCQRIGVNSDNKEYNFQNSVLREGCAALGFPCEPIPRNAPPPHACGWCHFGCREGGKQSTPVTWLLDAVRRGATIVSSAQAQRVLLVPAVEEGCRNRSSNDSSSSSPLITKDSSNSSSSRGMRGRKTQVVGVLAVSDSGSWSGAAQSALPPAGRPRHVLLKAPLVVVACGSIHTPALLLRSGLRNPNIGTHLRVHPVSSVLGYFPEEDSDLKQKFPGRTFVGGIMTAFSGIVGNWGTTGYGALIQTPSVHPGVASAAASWWGQDSFVKSLLRYSRTAVLITITRDTGHGQVYLDKTGNMGIRYDLNATDAKNMMDGIKASLRIFRAAGAHEVATGHQMSQLRLDLKQNPGEEAFEDFLKQVERAGIKKGDAPVFSAHQLGSCPMGTSPGASAVDHNAESWEASGLFLGDGSVLPTPSGVNPMVTIESVAFLVGSRLAERYKSGEFTSS